MKKTPFIVLLVIEAIAGLFSLGIIYSWFEWLGLIPVSAVMIALLAFLVGRLKKQTAEGSEKAAGKTRIHILLAVLIPTVVALTVGILTFVSLLIYFG